jgi:hypothetical protein
VAENRSESLDTPSTPALQPLVAEVLRNAAAPVKPKARAKAKGEESISPFWRIFGGTVLSILALVAITLYQQLSSSLNELRHGVAQMTSKEEFVTSRTKVWEKFFEIQTNTERGNVVLADRCARLEQQVKEYEVREKEMRQDLQWLREATIAALKDRSTLLEQQLKASQTDHQDHRKELEHLRARLAVVEGRAPASATGHSTAHDKDD